MPPVNLPGSGARALCLLLLLLSAVTIDRVSAQSEVDHRAYLSEMYRLGLRKPFLTDSPDIYLEPQSLNRFFTAAIYRKLEGNAYFGYRYDEGFVFDGSEVRIDSIKSLASGSRLAAAYRLALEKAIAAAGMTIAAKSPHEIGICIVGIEEQETDKTLAGVMVEAYLRNALQKKSFFIRYGAGSPRALPAAIRLSATMLVSELDSRRKPRQPAP